MVKEIYSRNWDFTLYETSTGMVINVVFFGLVDFHRSFLLNSNEIPLELEDLKDLSEKIRNNYESYKQLEIIPAINCDG